MRNRTILAVLLFFLCGAAAFAQGILVEAESFREKGGWAVDRSEEHTSELQSQR